MDEARGPRLAAEIAALLAAHGETLAVAETAAGGLISATLLAVAGASAWFLGGTVAYSAGAKQRWLGVTAQAFGDGGAVSGGGARVMAEAARQTLGATWGLAEVGIAGPQTGRRSSKPAGLAWLAVSGPATLVRELRTGIDVRARNQASFALGALELLADALRQASQE